MAAGNAADLADWLGPAGAAIFGAGTVWAGLQRRLDTVERRIATIEERRAVEAPKVEAVEKTVKGLEQEVEQLRRRASEAPKIEKVESLEKSVKALEQDVERLRRRTRSIAQELDSMRSALRMMLIALKSDGVPRDELLADVSSSFAVPVPRAHDSSG